MQIVCPNCQTSYGVTPSALGPEGRNVRCAKCKQVWHARPEEALQPHDMATAEAAEATAMQDETAGQTAESWSESDAPHVESPSLAPGGAEAGADWPAEARRSEVTGDKPRTRPWRPGRINMARPHLGLSGGVAAMAALIAGLIIWRADVVRLLPQTAAFFQLAGINVNLRNLTIEDVRVSTETVNGAPVTVIEGAVATTGFKPAEIPRLRFVVRDAGGNPVYAWNTVLEQAMVNPGEKVQFKSRLASPPPNAYDLVVRFFNKRDIGT
jgi:predicted Zn finger-like uncharacterized protein